MATLINPGPPRVVLALLVALTLNACGTEDAGTADSSLATAEAETAATAQDVLADSMTVDVSAVDYAYTGLPDQVPAGTMLTLHNDSEAELHEMVVFRLLDDTDDRSFADLIELPDEEFAAATGGEPVTVILAPPGEDGVAALGDGTLAEPGRYLVICAIPTGADPQEYLNAPENPDGPPDLAGGPPHFTQGMVAEITVS